MTNSKPLSVIFGTYKNPELIIPTLEGLKNQSFKEFVVYVVDDNSPNDLVLIDRAKSIINQYKELDIHFIKNETNIGVPHVFRKWIGLAKTKYFYICGAGDRLVPGAFESMVSFLEENPEASMVHGLETKSSGRKDKPLFKENGAYDAFIYLTSHLQFSNRKIYSWSQAVAIFRTELFKVWNTPITSFHYWDYYFHCSYLLLSKRVGYINEYLCVRYNDKLEASFTRLPDFVTSIERLHQALLFIEKNKSTLIHKKLNVHKYILNIKVKLFYYSFRRDLNLNQSLFCLDRVINSNILFPVTFLITIALTPVRFLFKTIRTLKYRLSTKHI